MRMSCLYLFLLFFIPVQAMDIGVSLLWHAPSILMASYLLVRPTCVKRAAVRHPYATTGLISTGWALEQGHMFYQHHQGTIGNLSLYGGTAGLAMLTGATLLDLVCVQHNRVINCIIPAEAVRLRTAEPAQQQFPGD